MTMKKTNQFEPMNEQQLIGVLGLTIKHDNDNKLATFLCMLSAYTKNAQFNISYNAPSSTGKSYIPTEIARLFPEPDVVEIAYCSPTAFFHEVGTYDKKKNEYTIDFSNKILIFLDQPHNDLLARLRPMLSHDKFEIASKITDKSDKGGMRTKNVTLHGYPAVIFCTAGLRIDEQESTRFLLLSPEVNQDKIIQSIATTIQKEANSMEFESQLEEFPERVLLKERVAAIKAEHIEEINIINPDDIKQRFLKRKDKLKPRHQRDIKRLLAFVKAFALLNVWWREREGNVITANEQDVKAAFELWGRISVSQELNLPPYIYDLYKEVIMVIWSTKKNAKKGMRSGISRQEILDQHYRTYGRMLSATLLRQQILPMLETAGLIVSEEDPNDKRKVMVFPTAATEKNSEQQVGE